MERLDLLRDCAGSAGALGARLASAGLPGLVCAGFSGSGGFALSCCGFLRRRLSRLGHFGLGRGDLLHFLLIPISSIR